MKIGNARRKLIVIIVEGRSEKACLGPILSSLYDNMNPRYEVVFPQCEGKYGKEWGDFTTRNGIEPKNAPGCIVKSYVTPVLNRFCLTPDYVEEIIHIVDMDGAYIKDENILYDKDAQKYKYEKGKIRTVDVDGAIKRNEKKRDNIDALLSLSFIKDRESGYSYPYSMYFFSSNLDHFLYGDANIESGAEKVRRAENFATEYEDDPEKFLEAIKKLPGALSDMTYEQSWDYVKKDDNSIEPHTNINILLKKIMNK